ncbi:MAG: PAS domain-containing protein, partial [Spirochaetaceae bacterium]|nr:PAS domain-containing protein [Spirochaetaceae bacterium]
QVRDAYGYDRVIVLDPSGDAVLDSAVDRAPDAAIAAAVPEALRSEDPSFLDFYRDTADGRIYLSVLTPIGRADGVLALRVDPERYIYPLIQGWPTISATAETLLVRRDGSDVLFLNQLRFASEAALWLRFPIDEESSMPAIQAVQGKEGRFEGHDYRGIPVLSVLRAVPSSPWRLVARVDVSELAAESRESKILLALMVVGFIGSVIAGVLATAHKQRMEFFRREAQSRATLRSSEEKLRLALAAGGQGLFDLDVKTGEAQVNAEYASMLGFDPAGFRETAASWLDRVHPEDRPALQRALSGSGQAEAPDFQVEVRQCVPSGEWKWILVLGTIIERDRAGYPVRILGTTMETTRRRNFEDELKAFNARLEKRVAERTAKLEASNKELEAFAYSVAHDLRSPLRAIDGFCRILEEESSPAIQGEGLRALGIIRASANKMDSLISDLLELSRIGRIDPKFVRLDMRAMAEAAFAELAAAGEAEDFGFVVREMPDAKADPFLIGRVWTNLLSNAVKFSKPKPQRLVEVGGYASDGLNIYYVQDRGVGFDPRYADKLFGIFERLHSEAQFPGTGIGLAIVARVVARHGGRAWGEGHLGEGATFYFSLPATKAP